MQKQEQPYLGTVPKQPYLKSKGVETYYFTYTFFNHKKGRRDTTYVSTGETSYRKAQEKRQEILEQKLLEISEPLIEKSEVQSVNSLIEEVLKIKAESVTPKTLHDYRYEFRRFQEFADGKPIRDITPAFILDFLSQIKGLNEDPTRSSYAQQKAKRTLSVLFSYAVHEGRLERSPLSRIKLKKVNKRIRDFFRPGEFEEFWRKIPDRTFSYRTIKNLALLASCTGAREFELSAIELPDIHLDRGEIELRFTKNGEPRSVKITSRVQQAIERQLADKAAHAREEVRRSRLLFPNKKGQRLISEDRQINPVSSRFLIIRKLILPHRSGLHFHSIRHSFAQNAIDSGVPEMRLSRYIGHVDLQTTLRNYALLKDTDWREERRMTLIEYLDSLKHIENESSEVPKIIMAKPRDSKEILPTEPYNDFTRIRQYLANSDTDKVGVSTTLSETTRSLADAA